MMQNQSKDYTFNAHLNVQDIQFIDLNSICVDQFEINFWLLRSTEMETIL